MSLRQGSYAAAIITIVIWRVETFQARAELHLLAVGGVLFEVRRIEAEAEHAAQADVRDPDAGLTIYLEMDTWWQSPGQFGSRRAAQR